MLNKACKMLSGVATSQFGTIVHDIHRHEVSLKDDIGSLWYKIHEEPIVYQSHDQSHRGHPHVHFSHLVSTYYAGYYSYSCSQSYADDIFMAMFAKDPHNQNAWMKYRQGTLELGEGIDEMEKWKCWRDFLGVRPIQML